MAVRAIVPKVSSRPVGIRGHLPTGLWTLFLGRTMLPWCAYFGAPEYGLESAQGEMFDYTSRGSSPERQPDSRTPHDPGLV